MDQLSVKWRAPSVVLVSDSLPSNWNLRTRLIGEASGFPRTNSYIRLCSSLFFFWVSPEEKIEVRLKYNYSHKESSI